MRKLGQEIMQFNEQFSIYYIFWKINKTFLKTKNQQELSKFVLKQALEIPSATRKEKLQELLEVQKLFNPKQKVFNRFTVEKIDIILRIHRTQIAD
jgi:hypothetical protein